MIALVEVVLPSVSHGLSNSGSDPEKFFLCTLK